MFREAREGFAMGLFSSVFSLSRSSDRRRRSHRGSRHYKRNGMSAGSILDNIFSNRSYSGRKHRKKRSRFSWS